MQALLWMTVHDFQYRLCVSYKQPALLVREGFWMTMHDFQAL